MVNYYSKSDLAFWQEQQDGYQVMLRSWQEHSDAMHADWQEQHDAWQTSHDVWEEDHNSWVQANKDREALNESLPEKEKEYLIPPEPLEPLEPSPMHELTAAPEPPIENLVIYETRIVEQIEELETSTGTLVVMPGRIILTTVDGNIFSVSEQELSHFYIPVKETVVDGVEI